MTTLSDLEVMRLSAKGCGHELIKIDMPGLYVEHKFWHSRDTSDPLTGMPLLLWDPFTNDSQRWECEKKLLDIGWIEIGKHGGSYYFSYNDGNSASITLECPAEEFHARALAELERRDE